MTTDFVALINDITNYFEEDAKNQRKYINENKKEYFKRLKDQMFFARLLLVSELVECKSHYVTLTELGKQKAIALETALKTKQA